MLTKKIYDSVHGFIRFNEIENALIDSLPFQRLHYLHQLGIAYLVYPGATHTRFEHSLGAMELATRIFDKLAARFDIPKKEYWRQIIRLAALSHDLGHLPFSHVAEKYVLGKEGHEKYTMEIIKSSYLKSIWSMVPGTNVIDDVIKMAIGEKKLKQLSPKTQFTPIEKVLSEVVTADFFGADRIDYLLRDAHSTGVSHGLFDYHQLIEMLCILPKGDNFDLGIEENGVESCEALLLARHFMHKRVYQYPSVKAYAYHLAQCMKNLKFRSIDEYLDLSDNEIIVDVKKVMKTNRHAFALFSRKERFRALPLPQKMTEEELRTTIKNLKIPEDSVGWELSIRKKELLRLSFPVLRRNKIIVDASVCSEILIPLDSMSWIYISPEYENILHKSLDNSYN
ncbi:MAG: HD domain-containing protein [Chlamydiota bacterium]